MTQLQPGRPVIRETESFERTDRIVVELHPKSLSLRLKGRTGTTVEVSYEAVREFALERAMRAGRSSGPRAPILR